MRTGPLPTQTHPDPKDVVWDNAPHPSDIEWDAEPNEAPRWDVLGDIGRAAEGSGRALVQDVKTAFSPSELALRMAANRADHGFFGGMATDAADSFRRMSAAVRTPLDAVGVALSPVTGIAHSLVGSGLSYLLPTPKKDVTVGGVTFYANPKKAADQIIDSSLMMAGPRGMGNPSLLAAAAQRSAAANTARREIVNRNKAIDAVNRRAAQDKVTGANVQAAQAEAAKTGDKIALVDMGENLSGLAGAVYRQPGEAKAHIKNFLEGRDAEAGQNIKKDIGENIASGSTYHTAQDLLKARSQAARPAYKVVEDIGPIHSDRLQAFLDTPEIQKGLRRGLKLERQNALAEDRPFVDSDYAVTGYQDGNWDIPIFDKVPTMKSMIVANEGLGAELESMVNPATGRLTKDGLALKRFRDAFQGELDKLSGGKYREAREVWSGPSQSFEALNDGRTHFSRPDSDAQVKAEFDALSPGDKDFYRLGAAEAKIGDIERASFTSDKAKRTVNSERDQKRFNMLFKSDKEANDFLQSVARKRQMFDTKSAVMRNSATAGRLVEDEDHTASGMLHAAHGAGHALSGNYLGALGAWLRARRELGLGANPERNLEIARTLTDPRLPGVLNEPGRLLPRLAVPQKQSSVTSAAGLDALLNAPGTATQSPYNK